MANFAAVGVDEFVMVVGFRSESVVEYLERNSHFGKRFTIVENREWERGNGIAEVFDLDDATKVKAETGMIVDIGKDLAGYNALDCGIFRINARFFAALREQITVGRESISDAVQVLVRSRQMGIVEFPRRRAMDRRGHTGGL